MTAMSLSCAQLCVSPYNVRSNQEDAEATAALEASIERRGLLLPLVVHDMAPYRVQELEGEPIAGWGVLAGGRRLRAIRNLIKAKRLPADFAIDCVLRDLDPAEITELSLAENLLRRELRPYEVHAAIARAAEDGASVEEIATNIGQRERWVLQQLRLGTLAPEILASYRQGDLPLDQACAFAATEDHALQRLAWDHFATLGKYDRTPHRIRAFFKVGDRELEQLLRFVGDDVYRAAGGRFELDLFADEAETRGRVIDEGKLRELAENKLAHERQRLRIATGRSDLRFAAEPPQRHGYADAALELFPKSRGENVTLPDGEICVTLDVSGDGEVHARWWWASRKAQKDADRASKREGKPAAALPPSHPASVHDDSGFDTTSNYVAAQAARAAVKDEHGLTADGLQVARSLRRELLRAILVANALADGTLGRDYATWSQLRQELGRDRDTRVGARGLTSGWHGSEDAPPADIVNPHLAECKAADLWNATVESLREQPFLTIAEPEDAFVAYYLAPEKLKRLAGAVLAGLALLRSANVAGWRVPVHDRLAELAGADDATLRELWQPSAAFIGLLPKMRRLELAQPHVEPEHFKSWHKLADKVLTGSVVGVLAETDWIHPLLSFGVAPEQHGAREAAE
ncbi:ParB/RepB/Spo0J family partition protein [Novosphingobium aquimarinum]|uniref:ParB/RepB/Spo0J family partition protein n=1 Tax=Novosphingobium aquimarinum TaxID=2682494 RepID=UPI0012EC4D74|nr:ParB/RepB/Spo0J family partition protein [Novosphingobium aquimarinum]